MPENVKSYLNDTVAENKFCFPKECVFPRTADFGIVTLHSVLADALVKSCIKLGMLYS